MLGFAVLTPTYVLFTDPDSSVFQTQDSRLQTDD